MKGLVNVAKPIKITISFKNTSRDMKLYTVLKSLEEQSGTIKEILYKELIQDKEPKEAK